MATSVILHDASAAAAVSADDLVARVLAGDTDAFASIVERYRRDVWRVAAAMLHDTDETENIVQQSFVRAYERLHQFETGRDLGSWLKGIARHLLRDEQRRSSRESTWLGRYRQYMDLLYENDALAVEQEQRLAAAVAGCKQRLSEPARSALALHYEQGLTVEAAAAALGKTAGSVRQLLFRARVSLRTCVERKLTGD